MVKVRKALISVSNKEGLTGFATGLTEMGVKIISTGGTAAVLRDAGLEPGAFLAPLVYPEHCIGCGMCLAVCPHQVFAMQDRKATIVDRNGCMECGACALNCPVAALARPRWITVFWNTWVAFGLAKTAAACSMKWISSAVPPVPVFPQPITACLASRHSWTQSSSSSSRPNRAIR